jgi:hypothetical protein
MSRHTWIIIGFLFLTGLAFFLFPSFFSSGVSYVGDTILTIPKVEKSAALPPLDKEAYDAKLLSVANNPPPKVVIPKKDKDGNDIPPPPAKPNLWPVKTVYPNAGALLPFNRIVAFYGNLYSTKMGVLGEYPEDQMLAKLEVEVKKWELADPGTPVIPALHYIAVVAQGSEGKDGKYRFRMPDSEIDKVLKMADKIHALVFLDFQVAFSTLDKELPLYEKYFKMPNVQLGIDPEFSMKNGIRPGKVVGTFDAADVNYAANFLAKIVKENNLAPKVLVVHRYTQKMVTNYQNIKPLPEVEIVMDMDGWGGQSKKVGTYRNYIYPEPVQFTGFKLFYKNDILTPGTVMMSPEDVLKLNPMPLYIQYQ